LDSNTEGLEFTGFDIPIYASLYSNISNICIPIFRYSNICSVLLLLISLHNVLFSGNSTVECPHFENHNVLSHGNKKQVFRKLSEFIFALTRFVLRKTVDDIFRTFISSMRNYEILWYYCRSKMHAGLNNVRLFDLRFAELRF